MYNRLGQSLDFNQLQALNLVLHNLTGAPSSPVEGQKYINTTTHIEYTWNGTTWINALDRTNHTGTQTASTISDFDTQVQTSRLDQMAAPTSSVDMNSQKITGLGTPTLSTDATTKGYVDALINGTDWKDSVRCATTENITLSGLQTLDGITVVANDRVLVKNQTDASENGIYVASSSAWSRATDADEDGELTAATALFVEEGTLYADTQWRVTTDGDIAIDTTEITFGQIGAGTSYTAGDGIDITGSAISIDDTVVVQKYAETIGDNSNTSFTITHGLGTIDVQVVVREVSTGEEVMVPNKATSTTQVVVEFGAAPVTDEFRVIVQG